MLLFTSFSLSIFFRLPKRGFQKFSHFVDLLFPMTNWKQELGRVLSHRDRNSLRHNPKSSVENFKMNKDTKNTTSENKGPKKAVAKVPNKKALFNLIKDYRVGDDKVKLLKDVVDLVEFDCTYVNRMFWAYATIECDGLEFDDEKEGTFDDIEGVAPPLWMAAGKGLDTVVSYLIEQGGNPNFVYGIDCGAVSTVCRAIIGGNLECVKILHKHVGTDAIKNDYLLDDGNMANVAAIQEHDNVSILEFLTDIGVGPVDNYNLSYKVRMNNFFGDGKGITTKMTEAIKENQKALSEK